MTTGKTVLMGKNTYLSLPKKFRPLPNRKNIVISSQVPVELHENLYWYKSLDIAFEDLKKEDEIYIIGGATIYEQTIDIADIVYATEVQAMIDGDVYFPSFDIKNWSREVLSSFEKNERNEYSFDIVKYSRKHKE